MKTIITKHYFLFGIMLGFTACTQSEFLDLNNKQLPVEDSRAVFSTTNDFLKHTMN